MKKLITAAFCTALALASGITAYAKNLDRDYIETEIWDDIWNGKGDNGLIYPEASYKHHLLDEWIDENYGSDNYDWSEICELKYAYKDYYRDHIQNFDFEDDNNGNWTITTPEHSYSFTLFQGEWSMLDENGDTVDTFPPFSTLEENEPETNGEGSPRVIGKVTGGSQPASEELSSGEGNITDESLPSGSEGNSERSGVSPIWIFAGVAVLAGIGGATYYINKKK